MSLTMWLLLIFGLANDQLQLRAESVKKTCAAHDKWTVFQRRKYGNVHFYRGWNDYVNGFGDCDGDFWLGLEALHQMTKGGNMALEINMMTGVKKSHWVAKYSHFRVGSGSDNYTLYVSGFSGSAPYDSLKYHNNLQFSTKDADHDAWPGNYASIHEGAWWYAYGCGHSNLNGHFYRPGHGKAIWWRVGSERRTVARLCCSEMKIYKRL